MSSTITKLVTANELLVMPDDGFSYELVFLGQLSDIEEQ